MENKCQEKGFLWHFMSMIYIENDVANVLKAADLMYIYELELLSIVAVAPWNTLLFGSLFLFLTRKKWRKTILFSSCDGHLMDFNALVLLWILFIFFTIQSQLK